MLYIIEQEDVAAHPKEKTCLIMECSRGNLFKKDNRMSRRKSGEFDDKNEVVYLSLNISKNSADTITMGDLKKIMIKKAKDRYKKIRPCGRRRKLDECFTVEDDRLCFWFNTEDQSTHVLHTQM
jgi:hypothetical protein